MEESAGLSPEFVQNLPGEAGLLLVGHGTRDAAGTEEFLETARLVAQASGRVPLEACFLEFAEPTIRQGVERLVARGARRLVVVPVLLFAAGHAKRDIPEEALRAVSAMSADQPGVEVWQAPHLGCHQDLLTLSQQRCDEVLAQAKLDVSPRDTWLVMVGRGSNDPDATREMHEFATLRQHRMKVGHVAVGFAAMATPKFTEVLDAAAASGARRIVVQPHLLFGGVLLDRIGQTLRDYSQRYPQTEWLLAAHLGPAPQLVGALLSRAGGQLSHIGPPAKNRAAS